MFSEDNDRPIAFLGNVRCAKMMSLPTPENLSDLLLVMTYADPTRAASAWFLFVCPRKRSNDNIR